MSWTTWPRCWHDADVLVSRGPIDLEAKFEANLLNTAVFLLGLSQQVSTFAINFQVSHRQVFFQHTLTYSCRDGLSVKAFGRTALCTGVWLAPAVLPFQGRQILSPNSIDGCRSLRWTMRLVPDPLTSLFSADSVQFKLRLTASMVIDFIGCWVIESVCKYLFADLEPKSIVTRGRERREKRRASEEQVQQVDNEKKTQ